MKQTENFIHHYWESQAKQYGGTHLASWGDIDVINLEIQTIGQYIGDGHEILDVGCANGYSALHHSLKNIRRIVGIDFSESMIKEAEGNRIRIEPPCEVSFIVADARDIPFAEESFDLVYTTRMLINLPNWDEQKRAMSECIRVCRKGGTIIFSEAFWEPLALLNALRALVSLPFLVEHDCNRFLKKAKVTEFLTSQAFKYEVVDFCSIFYLGTRFLQDLVVSHNNSDDPTPIKDLFYEIEQQYSGGGFGIQQAFVISK